MNDETPYGDQVMNLIQAAEYLGLHYTTLNTNWKSYNLPPTKMGNRLYWFRADLDAFIAKRVAVSGDPSLRGRLRAPGQFATPPVEELMKARQEQAA